MMKLWNSLAGDGWIDWCNDHRDSDPYRGQSCRVAGDLGFRNPSVPFHRGSQPVVLKLSRVLAVLVLCLSISSLGLAMFVPSPASPTGEFMNSLLQSCQPLLTTKKTYEYIACCLLSWLALFIRLAAFFSPSKLTRNLS